MPAHYRIELLTNITIQTSANIAFLLKQFGEELSPDYLQKLVDNPLTALFVALDINGRIIGMATMITFHKLDKYKALVEDVVVDERHRRLGIGKELMKAIINKAKELNLDTIHLTSRPERVAANILYQKMGFKKYETNYYKYDLH